MIKLFVIDGHGAGDPGACAGGYTEADLVRQLSARIAAIGGSEVQIGDTSRNWYVDNGIGKGHCPKGVPVIELHMDSASPSARGGHVIIKSGFEADNYDTALSNYICGMFPDQNGNSRGIVGRSDLANPNRAAVMGVNYRLLECCFISNDEDRAKFINQMDDVARGILAAFGIGASSNPSPAPAPQPSKPSNSKSIDEVAREVVAGKWGNGSDRMNRLRSAGYDADAVQRRVNELLGQGNSAPDAPKPSIDDVARRVIAGEFGNGSDRANRLRAAGYDPNAVQRRVNELLGQGGSAPAPAKKSIDTVAREVIRGDWGNGQDRTNRLRAAGYDPNAVQRRVNQLM